MKIFSVKIQKLKGPDDKNSVEHHLNKIIIETFLN